MTMKITLVVDPERGEELIYLLVKAFNRNELGIGDLRIERANPIDVGLKAIKQTMPAKPKQKRGKRENYSLGMRAMKSGRANGVVITLTGLSHDARRDGLLAMWRAHGLNSNGLSATLSKLQKRGYVTNPANGVWRLTPQGQDFVQQWRQTHDHANGE